MNERRMVPTVAFFATPKPLSRTIRQAHSPEISFLFRIIVNASTHEHVPRDNIMWRALISILTIAGASSSAVAQTVTDPADIASRLKFWTQETGDPVYFGEVRNVDARTKRIGGHYQCLALAFIKFDGGFLQYTHTMWGKSPDGSCHYGYVTLRKVGNHGACVKDANAGFDAAIGTARMTKDNIDFVTASSGPSI